MKSFVWIPEPVNMSVESKINNTWRPNASVDALRQRAKLLHNIRQFFFKRQVMEVETPQLAQHTVTDPHINSFSVNTPDGLRYLQTSPEYHMKRLLAAGSGPIYQIAKAYRLEEQGPAHNAEFSLLEWYRPGMNHHQLMQEVELLLRELTQLPAASHISYQSLFQQYLNINPHQCQRSTLIDCLNQQKIKPHSTANMHKDDLLQWLMSEIIEPKLQTKPLLFVYDYPASQAALAKLSTDQPHIAHRFEMYLYGVELANGFDELCDAQTQLARFKSDIKQSKPHPMKCQAGIDPYLIQALQHGLPPCSGVALGIDRLVQYLIQSKCLADTLSFAWDRA